MNTASEFHPEAPQATASDGRAQGPYVAARAGFEPNESPCPTHLTSMALIGRPIPRWTAPTGSVHGSHSAGRIYIGRSPMGL